MGDRKPEGKHLHITEFIVLGHYMHIGEIEAALRGAAVEDLRALRSSLPLKATVLLQEAQWRLNVLPRRFDRSCREEALSAAEVGERRAEGAFVPGGPPSVPKRL